ncbi:GDSL esterase/lipase [Abeliophyllum distichum]|uniref:GDSL esterase/lipase n=1 Tax=Abeliophyllum distichum TaxID=126358 RepID=A0ABD1RQ00_9LAMI
MLIAKGHKFSLSQCPKNEVEVKEIQKIPYALAIGSLMYDQLSPMSNALHILPKFPYFDTLNFDKIYQVGDSISDTGNLIRESSIGSLSPFARLPYGETFFKNATGRCSNGLLMIDFIALSAGLPLLKPYKEAKANFSHGVNFAVAGSTALPVEILAAMNVLSPVTTSSLDVQLDWMHSHFNSTCQSQTDCAEKNSNSLFMVGEIGGNDYNYALFQGKSIQELKDMVPLIVDTIANAVRRVIRFGATRVVVPGFDSKSLQKACCGTGGGGNCVGNGGGGGGGGRSGSGGGCVAGAGAVAVCGKYGSRG